jgi:hypothetical protein
MVSGTFNITSRPIKFGFLVNDKDKDNLSLALEINSHLWGGQYNPIIPVLGRPNRLKLEFEKKMTSADVCNGYIDTFDPDFLVPLGNVDMSFIDRSLGREIVKFDNFYKSYKDYGHFESGVGLNEILEYWRINEFRFVRKNEEKILIPSYDKKYAPFLTACFGKIRDDIATDFTEKIFGDEYHSENLTLENYLEFMVEEIYHPLKLSSQYLSISSPFSWHNRTCILIIDGKSTLDIIDFWNLRALGWTVIPIPIQIKQNDNTLKIIKSLITKTFQPHKNLVGRFQRMTMMKGRTVNSTDYSATINVLLNNESDLKEKVVEQTWYPRLWNKFRRKFDSEECCELYYSASQSFISFPNDYQQIATVTPPFVKRKVGSNISYANEINVFLVGGEEPIAEAMPIKSSPFQSFPGGIMEKSRFSNKGLVLLCGNTNSFFFQLPKAEAMMIELFDKKGFNCKISDKGLIAKQVLHHLGGVYGVNILANKKIIKLLENINKPVEHKANNLLEEDLKGWDKRKVIDELKRINNEENWNADPLNLLKRLVDANILRLGLTIQCNVCQQHGWYPIDRLDYDVICNKCYRSFKLPTYNADNLKWSYVTYGPFRLPNHVQGALATVICARFFKSLNSSKITPILSSNLTLKSNSKSKFEVDYAMLSQSDTHRSSEVELLLAEIKTFKHFDAKDIDKMSELASHFPNATLAFVTLNDTLTEIEKRMILKFVKENDKRLKLERPYNPILIITGNELFSNTFLQIMWERKGWNINEMQSRYGYEDNYSQLSRFTQEIYLGYQYLHTDKTLFT